MHRSDVWFTEHRWVLHRKGVQARRRWFTLASKPITRAYKDRMATAARLQNLQKIGDATAKAKAKASAKKTISKKGGLQRAFFRIFLSGAGILRPSFAEAHHAYKNITPAQLQQATRMNNTAKAKRKAKGNTQRSARSTSTFGARMGYLKKRSVANRAAALSDRAADEFTGRGLPARCFQQGLDHANLYMRWSMPPRESISCLGRRSGQSNR